MPREDREPDELFEIRTNFYTGNYQQVINEATKLKVRFTIVFFLYINNSMVNFCLFRFHKIYKQKKIYSCIVHT